MYFFWIKLVLRQVLDIPKLESQSGLNGLKNEVIPTSGTQIVYNLLESISSQENENPLEKSNDSQLPSDAIPYLDDQEVDTLMSDISEQSREVTSSFDETGTISRDSLEGVYPIALFLTQHISKNSCNIQNPVWD